MKKAMFVAGLLAIASEGNAAPSKSAPVFDSMYSTHVTTTMAQPGKPGQSSHGIQAWNIGGSNNRTAWIGDKNPWVADFDEEKVWYTDGKVPATCMCQCQLPSTDTACSTQIEGGPFCGFDYTHNSKYVDDVVMPDGTKTHHYMYLTKLAIITMGRYDLYFDEKTGFPVQQFVQMTPFGHPLVNFTQDFSNFENKAPPADYFTVNGAANCQQCDPQVCGADATRLNAFLRKLPTPKQ